MKIAFIIPSPTVLKHDWYKDLLYQKVGIANLAGWLMRAGYSDISQYDFNNQIKKIYEKRPDKIRLMLYSDDKAVKKFLKSDELSIRKQTEFLINALKVKEHNIFSISLSAFLGDIAEINLGINIVECMAKILKRKFPKSLILLGGLQNMSMSLQREKYIKILKECKYIDCAVCGEGHNILLNIIRAFEKGITIDKKNYPNAKLDKIDENFLIEAYTNAGEEGPHYFSLLPDDEVRQKNIPIGFPYYDKKNSKAYSYSGEEIKKFYHLPEFKKTTKQGIDNYLTLQVSFGEGCPFNCFFCSSAHSPMFYLDIKDSIEILKIIKNELGCQHFLFYDPNFNPTYKYAHDFLEAIIKAKLNILWSDCFNLRNLDKELISMMREAGVIKIVAGVEYPTDRMLKYINKGITLEQINRNLEYLDKEGIWNHVLLITGMPTETWDDVKEMEKWLLETKDIVNSYTVGSFHMVSGSPFYKNPEKFGFKLKDAMELYCQYEFGEKNGLTWEKKRVQNIISNQHIRNFIDEIKGSHKPTSSRMDDSHLLMYLYRNLGHKRKKEIEKIYEDAYTVNPHIEPALKHLTEELKRSNSTLNKTLKKTGMSLFIKESGNENIIFTISKGEVSFECSLRARSEDILINKSENIFQGDFFALKTYDIKNRFQNNIELTAFAKRIGAELLIENVQPAKGTATIIFTMKKYTVRFELYPCDGMLSFKYDILSGESNDVLMNKIGHLLLKTVKIKDLNNKKDITEIKNTIPEILKVIESCSIKKT